MTKTLWLPMSLVLAGAATAQTSRMYLTTNNTQGTFVVQGGEIVGQFDRASIDDGPAFVIQNSVKTFGNKPGDVGHEYDYAGNPLAGQYPNLALYECRDGATDGTRNWTVEAYGANAGAVSVGNADWSNMQFAFQALPYTHGITYDPTDDTLWTLRVWSYGTGDLEHYSTSGAWLGRFPIIGPGGGSGIALDLADQTLWVYDNIYEDIWQYDKNGNALQALYVPGLHGKMAGAEFLPQFDYVKYCSANANSTGAPADLSASGSASAAVGNLRLEAAPVPDQNGIFFHALNQVQLPFGNGFLCASVNIVRGTVELGSGNVATYVYDNSDSQHSLGGFVGATRNFQYWFRDPMGGGAFFNTSNAISTVILP